MNKDNRPYITLNKEEYFLFFGVLKQLVVIHYNPQRTPTPSLHQPVSSACKVPFASLAHLQPGLLWGGLKELKVQGLGFRV